MSKPTLLEPGNLKGHPDEVPVDVITRWIRKRMAKFGGAPPESLTDRVLIVQSETGSGKSTVLPAELFRILRDARTATRERYRGRSVICTQPRVLTAMTLARDMIDSPHYPDLAKTNVGFQTGPVSDRPRRGLLYATAGVLMAQLFGGDVMDRYEIIIVDEAHERSLDTDMLMYGLKRFLLDGLGNPKLPFLVLASATIDTEKYADYFGGASVFRIVGRQYEIAMRWPAVGTNDYMKSAVERVAEIHKKHTRDPPDRRDILVFLPGGAEIAAVETLLLKRRKELDEYGPLVVLKISRSEVNTRSRNFRLVSAPLEDLWRLHTNAARRAELEEKGLSPRRVIVSTVVAETGLTINTLRYVIDGGWHRTMETYHPWDISGLLTQPATQSRMKQRWGRVGRLFPGVVYPLYTRKVFEAIPEQQLPEIITEGPERILLKLIGDGRDTLQFGLLDEPPAPALHSALRKALSLGFARMDEKRLVLTPMGEWAKQFIYLEMERIRLVFAASLWKVAVTDVVAMIVAQDTLGGKEFAKADKHLAEMVPACFKGVTEFKDFVQDEFVERMLLVQRLMRVVNGAGGNFEMVQGWCKENGLPLKEVVEALKYREFIIEELVRVGVDPFKWYENRLADEKDFESYCEKVRRLKYCIYDAYRLNLFERRDGGLYRHDMKLDSAKVPKRFAKCSQVVCAKVSIAGAPYADPNIRYSMSAGTFSALDTDAAALRVAPHADASTLLDQDPTEEEARKKAIMYHRLGTIKSEDRQA